MSTPPSLLDILDTTVTLEWGDTRSMGTLLRLGGRRVVITALRAPEVGTTVYLRVEDDKSGEAMAVDGVCCGVTQSDWGEQEVEIDVKRVGTVASAGALRNFLERHGLEAGGAVSVGRNRDNPDLKRYVYSLPEPKATTAAPAAAPLLPAAVTARTQTPVLHEPTKTLGSRSDLAAQVDAARAASAAPLGAGSFGRPTAPSPPPAAAIVAPPLAAPGLTSADQELADLLSSLTQDNPSPQDMVVESPAAAPASYEKFGSAIKRPAPSSDGDATVELSLATITGSSITAQVGTGPAIPLSSAAPVAAGSGTPANNSPWAALQGKPAPAAPRASAVAVPPPAASAAARAPTDHDYSEKILVQTVDQANTLASPVMQLGDRGKAPSGLLGRQSVSRQTEAAAAAPSQTEPLGGSTLFVADSAQRIDMAVQFESGPKKKKSPGKLVRLGESKLRINAATLPELYERIAVLLPLKNNPKNILTLRCEVTRVRNGEDGSEPCFDARLTAAGNSPAILSKVREILAEPGN